MGSHRDKDKDKKKRRSSLTPEREGKSKRHRTSEEKSEKRKKDKKSHKHRSDKEKKSKDKHKRKHKKHHSKNFQELTNDDYFLKNNEFSTWLKEEKNMFFSDLNSESARELFSDFVKAWNSQKLDSQYYEGIATGPRSRHSWKIRE